MQGFKAVHREREEPARKPRLMVLAVQPDGDVVPLDYDELETWTGQKRNRMVDLGDPWLKPGEGHLEFMFSEHSRGDLTAMGAAESLILPFWRQTSAGGCLAEARNNRINWTCYQVGKITKWSRVRSFYEHAGGVGLLIPAGAGAMGWCSPEDILVDGFDFIEEAWKPIRPLKERVTYQCDCCDQELSGEFVLVTCCQCNWHGKIKFGSQTSLLDYECPACEFEGTMERSKEDRP